MAHGGVARGGVVEGPRHIYPVNLYVYDCGCVAIARRSALPHVASHLPTEPTRRRQEEGTRREEEETEGKQIKIQ